eukprot:6305950-Amphidinium_carterae.2
MVWAAMGPLCQAMRKQLVQTCSELDAVRKEVGCSSLSADYPAKAVRVHVQRLWCFFVLSAHMWSVLCMRACACVSAFGSKGLIFTPHAT